MKRIKILIISVLMITVAFVSCDSETAHVAEYYDNGSNLLDGNEKRQPKLVFYYSGTDSTNCREVQYYNDGTKKIEGRHKNGARDGEWTAWYRNGRIWSRGNYKDGYAEGTRRVYHENGGLYIIGDYKHGERVGEWIFYDSLGKELKKLNYGLAKDVVPVTNE